MDRSSNLLPSSNIMDKLTKRVLVKQLGGCCLVCKYNKCFAALHFHHLNPKDKSFNISSKNGWVVTERELEKCVLLCSNCHAEVHAKLINKGTLLLLKDKQWDK